MMANIKIRKMVNKAFGATDTKVVAKPRLYQEEGTTVLHIASVQGLVAVVKMILEAGAEVNALLEVSLFSLYSHHTEIIFLLVDLRFFLDSYSHSLSVLF